MTPPLDPLAQNPLTDAAHLAGLNARANTTQEVLDLALDPRLCGKVALVSSFGADSVVLLHMLAQRAPDTPVLFIDTEMLFPETLAYQARLARDLGLRDLRVIRPDPDLRATADPDGRLHQRDPDACCALRKTAPLAAALAPFDAWITGRKRYQASTRHALPFFEAESETRFKINPLAHWGARAVQDYIAAHDLPRHPLVARGYPSIGCAPCTTPVAADEDPRAGRWRNHDKQECGIHIVDGRVIRTPSAA